MKKIWLVLWGSIACVASTDPATPTGREPGPGDTDPTMPVDNLRPTIEPQRFTTPVNEVLADGVVAEDPEGDPLAFGLVRPPARGAMVLASDGTFTYEPALGFVGEFGFTVLVTDGLGHAVDAQMTLEVLPVGAPPELADAEFFGVENTPLTRQLVATDIDGDELRFDVVAGPSFGAVELESTQGSFVYTPDLDFVGTDAFDVAVEDGANVARATVTIHIRTDDDQPILAPATFIGMEDTPLTGWVEGNRSGLTFDVAQPPRRGRVTLDALTGRFIYLPMSDAHGLDDFTVIATGAAGPPSLPGRVTLLVAPVNDAPEFLGPLSLQTTVDTPIASQVGASDVEGDHLTFSVAAPPSFGTLVLSSITGAYEYSPDAGYEGSDAFTLEVDDGELSSTAVVTIEVLPASP